MSMHAAVKKEAVANLLSSAMKRKRNEQQMISKKIYTFMHASPNLTEKQTNEKKKIFYAKKNVQTQRESHFSFSHT